MLPPGWSPLVLLFPSLPVPLRIVLSAPTIIGITITFIFHSFFSSLVRFGIYVSFYFLLFSLSGFLLKQKPQSDRLSFFFPPEKFEWLILQYGFLGLYMLLIRVVKFELLTRLPVDYHAHQVVSSLILFWANLLHSLIMWLFISSRSPHNLHLLFCHVSSIFFFNIVGSNGVVFDDVRRDSVSFIRFFFLAMFKSFFS